MNKIRFTEIVEPVPDSTFSRLRYYSIYINGIWLYFSQRKKADSALVEINRKLNELLGQLVFCQAVLFQFYKDNYLTINDINVVSQHFIFAENYFMRVLQNRKSVYVFRDLANFAASLVTISDILSQIIQAMAVENKNILDNFGQDIDCTKKNVSGWHQSI